MALKSDYPYDKALDDLEFFLNKHMTVSSDKKELFDYLDKCRKNKTIAFRYIHEKFMKYRKDHSHYDKLTNDEKDMIDNLFHFWG